MKFTVHDGKVEGENRVRQTLMLGKKSINQD